VDLERQRIERAAAQEGGVLVDWVNRTRCRNPHDAAVRLFLTKVMREKIKRSTAQWALSRSGDSQSLVIIHGMNTLDQTRPDHWNESPHSTTPQF
jgi:hypothetical protein